MFSTPIISTVKKLPEMECSLSARKKDILEAEEKLSLKFADEYKEYLLEFGCANSEIIAISGISEDKEQNVVDLTLQALSVNEQIPQDFYVIETLGIDGVVVWQDTKGVIYQTVPQNVPVKLFDSLAEYLEYVIKG